MSDQTLHDWLAERLEPLMPEAWKLAPGMETPETIGVVTVAIKHLKIAPLAEAPKGHLTNQMVVTIANPHTDQVKSEAALDDDVLILVQALQDVKNLGFTEANKVLVNNTYLGWDISCSIISKKKEAPSA